MKRLYAYIVCFFCIFNNLGYASDAYELPPDFNGEITISRNELLKNMDSEIAPLEANQLVSILLEIGQYFNDKYPDLSVFDEDEFIENLRPFFPDDNDAQLQNKLTVLRLAISTYRKGKAIYNITASSFLAPSIYRKVHSEKDFDHPGEVSYIEAPEGQFVKVYNFKKFLTYGDNDDERKAVWEYYQEQSKDATMIRKIEKLLKKFEWRKLLLYGSEIKNPLFSEEGISQSFVGKNFEAVLLSDRPYIDNQKEILLALYVKTDEHHFVLANDLSEQTQKPEVNIADTGNVDSYEVLYPAPYPSQELPFAHKYYGEFLLPIKLTLKNPQEPVVIESNIRMNICGNSQVCKTEEFSMSLEIKPHGNDLFSNGYDNMIHVVLNQIPQKSSPYLELQKMVIDNDDSGQVVRMEFKSKKNVERFRVYLKEIDGYTKFQSPFISIKDNIIYVRFVPYEKQSKHDLTDSAFIVTAILNESYFVRNSFIATASSIFDHNAPYLNLALLFLAFLGGLILNFMPCVFPVLSLKIATVGKIAAKKEKLFKKSIKQTISGIFSGFSLLIILLLIAKFCGYSLGWGMQFQSLGFLTTMLFVISALIVIFPQANTLNFSNNFSDFNNKWINFSVGNLIVLLSTPCSGPYLATAIGFALCGTYTDIVLILYTVAFGLAFPYFLLLYLKHPKDLFPKPGKWMDILQKIAKLMLCLTAIWLLWLIYKQTNISCIFKVGGLLLLFIFSFKVYKYFIDYLNGIFDESITEDVIQKTKHFTNIFFALLLIGCFFCSWHIIKKASSVHISEYSQKQSNIIDHEKIENILASGKSVLVEIGADWCLTCQVNNTLILNNLNLDKWKKMYNLEVIKLDWTNYNREILDFMAKYGRKGIPFYILYTPFIRDGLVLPELLTDNELEELLRNN